MRERERATVIGVNIPLAAVVRAFSLEGHRTVSEEGDGKKKVFWQTVSTSTRLAWDTAQAQDMKIIFDFWKENVKKNMNTRFVSVHTNVHTCTHVLHRLLQLQIPSKRDCNPFLRTQTNFLTAPFRIQNTNTFFCTKKLKTDVCSVPSIKSSVSQMDGGRSARVSISLTYYQLAALGKRSKHNVGPS